MFILDTKKRPRRNRKSPAIRALLQENHLNVNDLIAPLFVIEGTQVKEPINSMPNIFRLSIDLLIKEAKDLFSLGINTFALFPVIDKVKKDPLGSIALENDNLLARTLISLKSALPQCTIIADVALDPYTSHGHDGLIDHNGDVINDATVEQLCKLSLHAAESGADIVAPSDMMDGRIKAIRSALDQSGYVQTSILSYAVKYASSFYGPFREALSSTLIKGDKKSYQMNPANSKEALLEALLDIEEGADMLMIKPALPYLDILYQVQQKSPVPVGAYHVSGEYAMVMAADEKGYLNAKEIFLESLLSLKRAQARFIFTYAAKMIAETCY